MGTWIKETDQAFYLMQGGYWISRITKYPSKTNPQEKVVNITGMRSWFTTIGCPPGDDGFLCQRPRTTAAAAPPYASAVRNRQHRYRYGRGQ
jgi:hypothetical protein